MPKVVQPDHRRGALAQRPGAPGQVLPEDPGEPLGVQVAALKVTGHQSIIGASTRASEPRSFFQARSWATVPGSMSITRTLPVLVGPSLTCAPWPLLRTTPLDVAASQAPRAASSLA